MPKEFPKVFRDLVAFTELEFQMEGSIIIPEEVQKSGTFRVGKVVSIGSGEGLERVGRHTFKYPGAMIVSPGEAVLFQMPKTATLTSAYEIRGVGLVSVVVQGDCLARMLPVTTGIIGETKYVASLDTMEALGDWMLLSGKQETIKDDNSVIERPDNALDITRWRFKVLQLGVGGDWTACGYTVGDSVVIERMRTIPFSFVTINKISGIEQIEEFYFLPKDYVLGVVETKE